PDDEREEQPLNEALTDVQPKDVPKRKTDTGVRVVGVDNLLTRIARCCTPVPGDDIIGYVTKGRGVSVHRTDCANVQGKDVEERLLKVEWEGDGQSDKSYHVEIEIIGFDRNDLLNDVLNAVTE